MAEHEVLAARGMTVAFGGLTVVDDVSVEVRKRAIVGLVGPNGSGKTSLVNAISGFVPARGEVELRGPDASVTLTRMPAQRRARAGVRRTFQTPQLFPTLSVLETVAASCARLGDHRRPLWQQAVGLRRARREFAEDLETARAALALVGLKHLASASPHRLALGQQRMVEVARAIANPGATLLLDEPFAGLSAEERGGLADLLRRVGAEAGWGMLIVDHDVSLLERLADTIVVMDTGRVLASGPPSAVLADEAVRRAYAGVA